MPEPRTRKPAASTGPATRSGKGRTLRRQGEETRSKLLAAALPALAEKGYQATRVDDVVRLAGVSHGTFYLYFANKEELFWGLATACADEAAELAASLDGIPAGEAGREALRTWLAAFVEFYRRHGVVIRAWTENQVADRKLAKLGTTSFGRISDTLLSAVAANPKRPSRRDQLRSAALLAMVERFAYVVTSRDLGLDDEMVLDNLATFVHRG